MASSEAASSIISNNNPLVVALAPLTNLQPSHQQAAAAAEQPPPLPPPAKKKRNLPGTPDPDAEVVALSPRTLLATNRFVCEICGKGFQRDQNLQLHRRGHNLPWKLRQRSGKAEPRKRVYVCPEKSCVHHNPARALGDLTGIKKHFCRKHGEKKWKCDKCSKRYAVQSDWKAHSKTCGTREYRCDCGTLFSRRDSFITHRAFCDALAEETARLSAAAPAPSTAATLLCGQGSSSYLFAGQAVRPHMMAALKPAPGLSLWGGNTLPSMGDINGGGGVLAGGGAPVPPHLYADLFAPTAAQLGCWLYGNGKPTTATTEAAFCGQQHAKPAAATDMSATALLHKAAQMGAVTSMSDDAGAAMFQHSANSKQLTGGNVAYDDDVLSAAARHIKDAVHVGREETRDFLGVSVQPLCSSSLPLQGWI